MRVYYHPRVGDYARCVSFEWDYFALAGAPAGVVGGSLAYFARRRPAEGLLAGLGGGLLVGGVYGALYPKRILSWFNPPPFDPPVRYPRRIPGGLVPSYIGDSGLVVDLLFYEGGGGVVRDWSGSGNDARNFGGVWSDEGLAGWCLYFPGVREYAVIEPFTVYGWREVTIEEWIYPVRPKPNAEWSKFSIIGIWGTNEPATFFATNNLRDYTALGVHWITRTPDGRSRSYDFNMTAWVNQWVHVVRRFTADREYSVWVNGEKRYAVSVPATEVTVLEWNPDASPHPECYKRFVLGANIWGTENMAVKYGLLRIYNRALSDEEIRSHFESTKIIFAP